MTSFFEDVDYMAIWQYTAAKLHQEGIKDVNDLEMVDKNFLKQLTDKLKHTGVKNNVGGAMFVTLDLKFCVKLQMILEPDSKILQFYKRVGGLISKNMIQWDPTTKDFNQAWQILVRRKGEDVLDVPNTSKALLIIKWTELAKEGYL